MSRQRRCGRALVGVVLSLTSARATALNVAEIVELRVAKCHTAEAAELRQLSSYLAQRPASVTEDHLIRTPGVILRGEQLRVRRVASNCEIPIPAETPQPWESETRNDRALFVPISSPYACDYFPPREKRLLEVSVGACLSDEVGIDPGWHDETRADVLGSRGLALLPADYGEMLEHTKPVILTSKSEVAPPPLPDPPAVIRAILATRIHPVEIRAEPRLRPLASDPESAAVIFDVEPTEEMPIICLSGRCQLISTGQNDSDGRLEQVELWLIKEEAARVLDAFKSNAH